MDKPIVRIGLPDIETFVYLLAALYICPPDVVLKVYTLYQDDIVKQLNIDPSMLLCVEAARAARKMHKFDRLMLTMFVQFTSRQISINVV